MRRVTGLWPQVIARENLEAAFHAARSGKRSRDDVASFSLSWERELRRLHDELQQRSYEPGAYRQFVIYERKARLISAAPFRDRVVHHALMRVVEPLLDRRMYFHSYACRVGKGVHGAVKSYQGWARRYAYVLKLDIRQYFPSIDRILLLAEIERYVKDPGCLWLFARIVNGAPPTEGVASLFPGDNLLTALERPRGLPIGNLTSQVLANLYLSRLDHWITAHHRGGYLRYVDDLLLLGDDKAALWAMRESVEERLAALRLRLHPNKAHVMRTDRKVDVLGYQVSRGKRWLRGENPQRAGRRLRGLARGYAQSRLRWRDVQQSIHAWIGHAMHADTLGLRRSVLSRIVFRRARVRA